jgi:hypothetical protein
VVEAPFISPLPSRPSLPSACGIKSSLARYTIPPYSCAPSNLIASTIGKKIPTSKVYVPKCPVAVFSVTLKSGWFVKRASHTADIAMKICRATATDNNNKDDYGDNYEDDYGNNDEDDYGDDDEVEYGDGDEDDYGDDDEDDDGNDDEDDDGDDDEDDYGDDDEDNYGDDDENDTDGGCEDVTFFAHISLKSRG